MNWLAFFLRLLPTFIQGAAIIGADLAGHQKKQMVTDAMSAIVEGVGMVAPQHAKAAALAASTAAQAIDGVHALLQETGALKPTKPTLLLVPQAPIMVTSLQTFADAVPAVAVPVVTVVQVAATPSLFQPGPGLALVSPA